MRTRENGETTLLYQTSPASRLRFCFYKDFIYFVERAGYDSPDDRDTALYRMDKDGHGLALLQDDILNASPMKFVAYAGEGKYNIDEYDIDIYDDIIYLLNYTYQPQSDGESPGNGNLYFKLESDGSVSQIAESGTLYGRLPKGFSPVREPDSPLQPDFPSLPYFMRNYGYLFLRDSQNILWRIDPVNGLQENLHIAAKDSSINYVFSGDTILLYSHSGGTLFLFGLSDRIMAPVHCYSLEHTIDSAFFPAEQGFYYCSKYVSDISPDDGVPCFTVKHLLPDGSENSLFYCTLPAENEAGPAAVRYDSSLLGDYFYYFSEEEAEHSLMRLPLPGTDGLSEPEAFEAAKSDSWPAWPALGSADIITKEREEKIELENFCSISYSIKELSLEEQTTADKTINQSLRKEAYADFEAYIEGTIQDERSRYTNNPEYYEKYGTYSIDLSLATTCEFVDDDTISFCCLYYEYFSDTIHSSHWCRYYTFDRHTGKRLSFEDFIEDPDLIVSVGTPYLAKAAKDWGFSTEYFFDPDRFALSADGYTLHFSPYEIGPYASGHITVTIPYEAFERE